MEKKKKQVMKKNEFEFCKVCRLNHDQGPRHKYFPRHKDSLSAFLDRFRAKVADVRFFLRNPSVLRPQEAPQNRVWCIFCDEDIVELGSSFACAKAINHLASPDHLKNLKHFLWKYGGGMDCIDTFRISQADVAQWEKKCQSLKHEAGSACKPSRGQLYGPSNDIHNEHESKAIDRIGQISTHPIGSGFSNDVIPLQYHTNEYQIPQSGLPEATNVGSHLHSVASHLTGTSSLSNFIGNVFGRHSISCSSRDYSETGYYHRQEACQVSLDEKRAETSYSPLDTGGNVHSGAPPPWLDVNDGTMLDLQLEKSAANRSGKSRKLNPKRVGAVWAERRKMELEMEKRGKVRNSDIDADWLPNFGRVWQSGTRKESRKEFEKEKQKSVKSESSSEVPLPIQPYISKRMRRIDGE